MRLTIPRRLTTYIVFVFIRQLLLLCPILWLNPRQKVSRITRIDIISPLSILTKLLIGRLRNLNWLNTIELIEYTYAHWNFHSRRSEALTVSLSESWSNFVAYVNFDRSRNDNLITSWGIRVPLKLFCLCVRIYIEGHCWEYPKNGITWYHRF